MKWLTTLTLCVFIPGLMSNSTSIPTTAIITSPTSDSSPNTTTVTYMSTTSVNPTSNTEDTTASTSKTTQKSETSNTTNTTQRSNETTDTITTTASTTNTTVSTVNSTQIETSSGTSTSPIETTTDTEHTSKSSITLTNSITYTTSFVSSNTITSDPNSVVTKLTSSPIYTVSNNPFTITSQITAATENSVTNHSPKGITNNIRHSSNLITRKSHNGNSTTSLLDGSLSTTMKPKVNNTLALGTLYNSTTNISSLIQYKIIASLNISAENITDCDNETERKQYISAYTSSPNASERPGSNSTSPYGGYGTYYYSTTPPAPLCNVTTVFRASNITYSFNPVHEKELTFIKFDKNDPFLTVLRDLDRPEEREDKRINETHESLCTQFSSHLDQEERFNFSSSFNDTRTILSLDRCKYETSVIIFNDHKTWYRYPQGVFLYALDKVLQYYHFNDYLTRFISTLDDHKCMFDVRSRVQYSSDGEKYKHYLSRHVTSWGVCNNFYQHVNITREISLAKRQ
ncbi:glycoprotein ORF-O [Elephant endotheliotropic herpesvirus 5B]|nr:ser/thr-rich glycoprotein ORF-O [Elephant endotheliotropic herpesvirus 5B]UVZ35287.1 glycoprotein ORF-O [Elephant endotheliotropic herpesvirus 5B]